MTIDWSALRGAAVAAARRAYAPYSGLRVGAAGQLSDGRIVVGSNVENASYGLTLCAECGLVSAFHGAGPASQAPGPASQAPGPSSQAPGPAPQALGPAPHAPASAPSLLAVSVVAGDGEPLLPCGRCRQLLLEAGGGDLLVDTADGPVRLGILLPAAFTPEDLSARREPRAAELQGQEEDPRTRQAT